MTAERATGQLPIAALIAVVAALLIAVLATCSGAPSVA